MTNTHEIPYEGLAARFRVVEAYSGGEGWSGLVVPREDDDDTGPRVLKILDAGIRPQEASVLASLEHPSIPRILDLGRVGDHWYLLREHVPGSPLQTTFPLDVDDAKRLAVSLLTTLAFVHMRGILHLDLKPSNVIRRDDGEYALLDFGLASRSGERASGGSLMFAAPERLVGAAADQTSDLYSVGVVLYCALGGPPPRMSPTAFRERVLRQGFLTAIGVQAFEFPAPFDRVLTGLLEPNPARRHYPDAQEVLEAIAGVTGRPSVATLRPDPVDCFRASIGRIRSAVSSGTTSRISAGDDATRLSVALHAASDIGDHDVGISIRRDDDAVVIEVPGADETVEIELPALGVEAIAAHLVRSVHAPDVLAAQIARHWVDEGIHSIQQVAARMEALVESSAIVPDGPRWIWPDAVGGRALVDVGHDSIQDARTLFEAAAGGRVRSAERAYVRLLESADQSTERELRRSLIDGLLNGGEPARALPLTVDEPVRRARSLFDLGQVGDAADMLPRLEQTALDDRADAGRLRALIALVRGETTAACEFARALVAEYPGLTNRVTLAQALLADGREGEARASFEELATELDPDRDRFLLASVLTGLGECQRRDAAFDAARRSFERARDLMWSLGHTRHAATATTSLGTVAKDVGDFSTALALHRDARSLYEHVGDERGAALARANLGTTRYEMGDYRGAVERLRDALVRFERLGLGQHRALLTLRLGRSLFEIGDRRGAREQLARLQGMPIPASLTDEARAFDAMLGTPEETDDLSTDETHEVQDMRSSQGTVPKEVFRTFLAINRRLAVEADLTRAMEYLIDAAVTITGGRSGYLLVARDDGLRREFHCGDARGDTVAFSRSMANRAVQQQRSLSAADATADRDLMEMPSVRNLRQRSALCVPFRSAGGNEGAIYVEHPGRADAFGPDERENLEVIADQAAIALDRMIREESLATELEVSQRQLAHARRTQRPRARMLGESPAMKTMRQKIEKIAASDLSVSIRGETGSGKELVARALHDASPRHRGPFVPLNCCAIPEQLMESELFGHVRGAFTGADDDHAGLLEVASGGTLFLDEIGDMPLALQAKLLRALQEKSIRRVGSSDAVPIDTRIVSATHKDLAKLVEAGQFRQDLFYRIVAAEVDVPPLRDREGDVALLADAFLAELNREHGRDLRWSETARRELARYDWPGNVRELQHLISRAFLLCDGKEIVDLELPMSSRDGDRGGLADESPSPGRWPVMTLLEAEERTIDAALAETGGEKTKAAKLLGISRTALYEKLKRMKRRGEPPETESV